jgi:hypothetical protein
VGTVGGPDTAEGPTAGSAQSRTPATGAPPPTPQDLPVVWRLALRDVLGRTTEAVIEHGGRTELAGGTVLTERYAGTVGPPRTGPGAPGRPARSATGSTSGRR